MPPSPGFSSPQAPGPAEGWASPHSFTDKPRQLHGELTPVPGESQPSPTSTCGCNPGTEVRGGTMWQKGPAEHNGRERAELAAERRGALGSPEQPAGSRAAAGTRSFHRDPSPGNGLSLGAAEKACGDGHTAENMELAPEKFPGEGASLWGSGPTRKGPDRGGQSRGSRGQVGAHRRSGSPGDPPPPRPAAPSSRTRPRARGTLTRADADSAMAASRLSAAGPRLLSLGLRAGLRGVPAPPRSRH